MVDVRVQQLEETVPLHARHRPHNEHLISRCELKHSLLSIVSITILITSAEQLVIIFKVQRPDDDFLSDIVHRLYLREPRLLNTLHSTAYRHPCGPFFLQLPGLVA